ncbi:hypothetical protein T310_9728 [Rasamsonia emersonii CBS 393.64]|uniref:UBC core domain-containing protein n=1 Tax=Rasamsonia emersonii (strain ATCC 16479 / CBS 393.64 / IMI 116815) TaxID=1408163 RepID=A0A0F4YEW6_RASE3|nr:hypothetical protein T310_9728 [Rasamsonia emersonii CBS 393.64]KKA16680.1 hypothetical protein T310_9728 [Rasamsonia emersonii CBS 393.64]
MSDHAILRITRESDIRNVKALIVGPPGTPYEFGFFESSSTWRGERGEEWSSAQGLESILISIQSLMSSNPYENEPGYEDAKSPEDKIMMAHYIAKIQHETLRIAVIQPLEDSLGIQLDGTLLPPTNASDTDDEETCFEDEKAAFEPFSDLRKRRFLWYYESYMQTIETAAQKVKPQEKFQQMSFEGGDNAMAGVFDYPELKRRIRFIKEAILNETKNWAVKGLEAKKRESRIAVNLQRQYEQVVEDLQRQKAFAIDLTLLDDNPFVWKMTYFGRPMTHLDGGIFKIKIHLSPRFPDEQPRVFVETPLFHHRVSKDGVLCYLPRRTEEMKHHIEAIVEALEEESPPYDPRTTVNLEASKLFWGSAEEKKKYYRALRKSVERSTE